MSPKKTHEPASSNRLQGPIHLMIDGLVRDSQLTNQEIANRLGYERANVIAMFRNGTLKVPINKAGALARTLGIDPGGLTNRLLNEYMPEVWQEVQTNMASLTMTTNEVKLLQLIRDTLGGLDVDLTANENFVAGIRHFVGNLADDQALKELDGAGHGAGESQAAVANEAMIKLLAKQARERKRLRDQFGPTMRVGAA